MLVWVCVIAIGLFGFMWGLEIILRQQQESRDRRKRWKTMFPNEHHVDTEEDSNRGKNGGA